MKNILFAIMAVFVLALTVGMATATPSVVTGNVYYVNGSNVEGASVTVICQHSGANTTSGPVFSLSDGSYAAYFNTTTCNFNDPVWVSASFDSMNGHAAGKMCNVGPSVFSGCPIPVALVNVTIPEFGLIGAMIVVIAGLGIVAYKRH